jgi:hypothetical protein
LSGDANRKRRTSHNRSRDSRYRFDRSRFLHVQPLSRRVSHLVAHGPGGLS